MVFPIVDGKKCSPIGLTSSKNEKNVNIICLLTSQLRGLRSVRAFKIELQIELLVLRRGVNRSACKQGRQPGELPYDRDTVACRKIRMKPLKRPYHNTLWRHLLFKEYFFTHNLKHLYGKNIGFLFFTLYEWSLRKQPINHDATNGSTRNDVWETSTDIP